MAKTKSKAKKTTKSKLATKKAVTKKKAVAAKSTKKVAKKAPAKAVAKKTTKKVAKVTSSKKKVSKKVTAKPVAKKASVKKVATKPPVKATEEKATKKAVSKKPSPAPVEEKESLKPVAKEAAKKTTASEKKASTKAVKSVDPDEDAYEDESFDEDLSSEVDGLKYKRDQLLGEQDIESKLDAMSFEELVALDPEAVEEEDEDEVVLTDAEGRPYCRVKDCDELSLVDGYCRFHYLAHWKRIQVRKKILAGGKLDRYIEELTARYPDKYLEMLRKDLSSEKDFMAVVHDLEIEDGNLEGDFEDDDKEYIDEVRGVGSDDDGGSDDY